MEREPTKEISLPNFSKIVEETIQWFIKYSPLKLLVELTHDWPTFIELYSPFHGRGTSRLANYLNAGLNDVNEEYKDLKKQRQEVVDFIGRRIRDHLKKNSIDPSYLTLDKEMAFVTEALKRLHNDAEQKIALIKNKCVK